MVLLLQYFLLVWNRTSKSQVKVRQFAALASLSFGLEPCYLVFTFILDLCCLVLS